VPVGARPSQLAVGDGGLWVANLDEGTFSDIDLRTRQVVRTLATGTTPATTIAGVTVGSGAIWAVDSTAVVRRVDLRADSVRSESVGGQVSSSYWALGPRRRACRRGRRVGPDRTLVCRPLLPSPEELTRHSDDVQRVLRRAGTGSAPLVVVVYALDAALIGEEFRATTVRR
jgi:hypothetical protein